MTTKEIQEIKNPVYPPFEEAVKSLSMDEKYDNVNNDFKVPHNTQIIYNDYISEEK